MLRLIVVTVAAALTIALLPLLAVPGGTSISACGTVEVILDTIRTVESDNNYTAKAAGSTASGAYQYIDTTWRHWAHHVGIDTTRYPSASMAPAADQDRAATANVTALLDQHGGAIDAIPIAWYYPAALHQPELLDTVPHPHAGNTLTIRQYQTRWLDTYHYKLAQQATRSCTTTAGDETWALPVAAHVLDNNNLNAPHHHYPAWDLPLQEGTPVHAIIGGTVTNTQTWTGNWWRHGCTRRQRPIGCSTCGVGVTIQTSTDLRHTYCHNRQLHVAIGDTVTTGQHIADSGNTGRSGTPHLHLELRINGTRRCPQPLLTAIHHQQPIPKPGILPTAGCTFQP